MDYFKGLLPAFRKSALFVFVCTIGALCSTTAAWSQQSLQPGDVNLEYSRVFVFVDRTNGLGHVHGIEGQLKSGKLGIDGSQPAAELVFDMGSFEADTQRAREVFGLDGETDAGTRKKVTSNMQGNEVLNVAEFPEAKLEHVSLTATGEQSSRKLPEYWMEGDLTLCRTTRHIRALCDLGQENGWHHLRGSFNVLQSDYGISPFSRALGAIGVKDELVIVGDLWLAPQK